MQRSTDHADANGVIIITTKKNREPGTRVNFQASAGVSKISHQPEVMTGDQYRQALQTENIAVGDFGSSVDAFDEILQTGSMQNYNLSLQQPLKNQRMRSLSDTLIRKVSSANQD